MKRILVVDRGRRNQPLSYADDWVEAFQKYSGANVDIISNPMLVKWGGKFLRSLLSRQYDGIFYMHSVTNDLGFGHSVIQILSNIKGPRFLFMGNEYRDLAAKVRLGNEGGCAYLLSQLPQDVAEKLYGPFFAGKVLSIPHALNDLIYQPSIPMAERRIDIGYRGEKYPLYLGHDERGQLFQFLSEKAEQHSIRTDIQFGRGNKKRLPRKEWAQFLNNCKCTIATETGAEFLSMSDKLRYSVNAFLEKHPDANLETIKTTIIEPLLKKDNFVSGRAISSRHFDAIGAGTCIISYPGRFNDILKPEEHYIALPYDPNAAETVLVKIFDKNSLQELSKRVRNYVLENHCLRHRVKQLMGFL